MPFTSACAYTYIIHACKYMLVPLYENEILCPFQHACAFLDLQSQCCPIFYRYIFTYGFSSSRLSYPQFQPSVMSGHNAPSIHGRNLQCAIGIPPHAYAGIDLHRIDAAVVGECGNFNGGQVSMGTM